MPELTLRELEQLIARFKSLQARTSSNRVAVRAEDVHIAIHALRLEILRNRSKTLQVSMNEANPNSDEIPRKL